MSGAEHLRGHTLHSRKGAVAHAFRHGVDFVLVDPGQRCRWLGGLVAVRPADHGGPPGRGQGAAWVRQVLAGRGLPGGERVLLLTQPRVLGHGFNPVSFWLCHDGAGALRVVLAEVTNTFGDRHSYLCHRDDLGPMTATDRLRAAKVLHVSPFQPQAGEYEFRFDIRPGRVGVWIDHSHPGGGVYTNLIATRRPLTRAGLLGACLRLGARRVWGLIHWQALRLWWKGAPYRPRPAPPAEEVSR